MIPKIIHYCWFGGEKPSQVEKYIKGWRKKCPDYEIKEWNENNFDIDYCPYVREAYNSRRFAFVSDVARLVALFNYGGIYLDTDVELLKNPDRFLSNVAFVGFENEKFLSTGIIGSEKNGKWIKECLQYYNSRHFICNGSQDLRTNVDIITEITLSIGLKLDNSFQEFKDLLTVYPQDVFSPKSWYDGRIHKTKDTVCVHHFNASWFTDAEKLRNKQRLKLVRTSQRNEYLGKCKNNIKNFIKGIFHI